jgi:hypothetical protein
MGGSMTTTKRSPRLVRYVSPFGSPAWMTRDEAQRYMAEDDRRWLADEAIGNLSDRQRQIGPPHIEVPKP